MKFYSKRVRLDFKRMLTELSSKEEFKFILIGANDGLSFDDIFDVFDQNRASGLAIEPSPKYFEELKLNLEKFKKVKLLNKAICEEDKKVLYQLSPSGLRKLPDWGKGIGSFDKQHLLKFGIDKMDMEEIEVNGISFMNLLSSYQGFYEVEYLQIDTEGYDGEIIKMIDFKKFHAKLIKLEWVNLSETCKEEVKQIFKMNNFIFFEEKHDSFAVHCSLRPRLK